MATTPFTYENPTCSLHSPIAPLSEEERAKMRALLNPQIQADASGNVVVCAEKVQQLYELLRSLNTIAYKVSDRHMACVVYVDPDRTEEVRLSRELAHITHLALNMIHSIQFRLHLFTSSQLHYHHRVILIRVYYVQRLNVLHVLYVMVLQSVNMRLSVHQNVVMSSMRSGCKFEYR